MGTLIDFADRVEKRLATAKREPRWKPDEAKRYMDDVDVRRQRFKEVAVGLNDAVIQPRLETLAKYFDNASLKSSELPGRCECRFDYCERFPLSSTVAFSVDHDIRFENTAVRYEAYMMPVFTKLNGHDRLVLIPDQVNDDLVGDWVEERLCEFLDAYLRVDRGGAGSDDQIVTDPVCGMRISRALADAREAYRGHPYYFCSTECQRKFTRDPTVYVDVKTM